MTAVLGITDSHCATAALLVDGRVTACVSEERFTRKKNEGGYPRRSAEYCLGFLPNGAADLDAVALAGREAMDPAWFDLLTRDEAYIDEYFEVPREPADWPRPLFPAFGRGRRARKRKRSTSPDGRISAAASHLGVSPGLIRPVDHHLCHAAAAFYASPFTGKEALVLTNDNAGDGLCASVNIAGGDGIRRLSASRSAHGSLGSFYSLVTVYLGMRQLEHEYKVMGMAPYAPAHERGKAQKIFEEMMEFVPAGLDEGSRFRWKVRKRRFAHMMMKLARMRFDWVAGAAQDFLEEMLESWVREGLRIAAGTNHTGEKTAEETASRPVALSGGIFMNVKANRRIAELPEISDLFVMPSCGDESNAIGAAYQIYFEQKSQTNPEGGFTPLDHLYLGPEFSSREIEEALRRAGASDRNTVCRPSDVETRAAELLVQDGVVARMAGRMEFGARALGNRSILADPRDYRVVAHINKMIKSRDFWMPFAPTVLAGRAAEYLKNPKGLSSPFMMLAFDTTPEGRGALPAATHPYDFTARPQILREKDNPPYHRLIRSFEERTGVGAVLNTSFNLHGDPIVCSPDEALETFERSELPHLILGDFLISKPSPADPAR
jgi:carbamoyltransferase